MEVNTNLLQQQLQAKEQELSELKANYEDFKQEVTEYEKELEADNMEKTKEIEVLQNKLDVAMKKMDDYKKEISQSGKIMDREKERLAVLSEEVTTLKNRIVYLEQLNEGFESEIRNIKFEKQELQEKLEGMEERFIIEKEDLEEQLNSKNAELQRFRLDVHEYEDEIVSLKRKSISKPKQDELKEGENEGKDQDQIEKLKEEVSKYKEEIEVVNSELGMRNQEIKSYEEKILEMQAEIKELTTKLEEKEGQLLNQEGELDEARKDKLMMQEQLEEKEKYLLQLYQSRILNGREPEQWEDNNQEIFSQAEDEIEERSNSNEELNKSVLVDEVIEDGEEEDDDENEDDASSEEHLKEVTADVLNLDEKKRGFKTEMKQGSKLDNIIAELSNGLEEERPREETSDKEFLYKNNESTTAENVSPPSERKYNENMQQLMEEKLKRVQMERVIEMVQEENKVLNDKFNQLFELAGLLGSKVQVIQEEKEKLQSEVIEKDSQISQLEKQFTILNEELNKLRNEKLEAQQNGQEIAKSRKLIPEQANYNLETMASENSHSVFKRSLYIKPVKGEPQQNYLKIVDGSAILEDFRKSEDQKQDSDEQNVNSLAMDNIFLDVGAINFQNLVKSSFESLIGSNSLFLIYGAKGTDKKTLKYKVLHELIGLYKVLSLKPEFKKKIFKVVIKVQDPVILEKIQQSDKFSSFEGLEKSMEIILGNEKSELKLLEYLGALKKVDFTKSKNVFPDFYWVLQGKPNVKQMVVELVIEDSEVQGKGHHINHFLKTKIAIMTMNSRHEKNGDSPFGIFLKGRDLDKYLILTMNPNDSEQSYQEVANTFAHVKKLEKAYEMRTETSNGTAAFESNESESSTSSPVTDKEKKSVSEKQSPFSGLFGFMTRWKKPSQAQSME